MLKFILNFNINPIIKNRGSAVFIHVAKRNYKPTAGCIALKKDHLIKLVNNLKKNAVVKIM